MEEIVIRQIDINSPDYQQVWQLREEILRKPIGLSLKDEDLGDDVKDFILVAQQGNSVIGCLMLQPKSSDTIKFRQMAVYPQWQGKGIGARLMHAAEHIAHMYGYNKIVLHARITAKDFYLKQDYTITGDMFTEVGIDHVVMEKQLAGDSE
jgi:N-acetylglutamate synthase-like GNAT family acetyltransferase